MNKVFQDIKLDKNSISVEPLSNKSNDTSYWLTKDPVDRLHYMEILRRINYGDAASSRLQRVFEITER